MVRRPRGYVGLDHEVLGSDILAILKACPDPWRILGEELHRKLEKVVPEGWYPASLILDTMDLLADGLGPGGLRQMGRALVKLSHAENIRKNLKTAGDLMFAMDGLYHNANRGQDIGGWKLVKFAPGIAQLEKTTPHHCWMEEGLILEAFLVLGLAVSVTQTRCLRRDAEADCCFYEITSFADGKAWMGGHPLVG